MKRIIVMIGLAGAVVGAQAVKQYRDFTSTDGEKIRGCIISLDGVTKVVMIERENRRRFNVPISVFTEEDQAYILEWNTVNEFMSSRCLSISVDKKRDNLPKEKIWKEKKSKTGQKSKSLIKEVMSSTVNYEVEFYLKNAAPMKDIRMEYKIYYEQSEVHYGRQDPEQKIFDGEISIPLIEPGGKYVVATWKVEIHKDSAPPKSKKGGGQGYGAKGDVHGVRARLYMKLPSGKKITREFTYPDQLPSSKYGW